MDFRVVAIVCAAVSCSTVVCGAVRKREIYVEKRGQFQDLETSASSASGYIYRTDGQNPPVFIKLGEGKNEKFDAILENFKRGNGFHGMPSVGAPPASPYNIPVVGQNDVHHSGDYSDHKRPSLHFGDLADNFDDPGHLGLDDADDISPIMDGHHFGGGDDGGDGGFDFGPSPFKYHHDVSPGSGLKSDSFGFDDQNYYGAPYTHDEHMAPSKHSKSGGLFHKAGHYSTHGSTDDSGYKNHHEFDKGHAGKYGKEDLKSHYKKGHGHSSGHSSMGDHYGKTQTEGHGIKGHKFGETESHKKGHKTTGFHNIYHKDEYNKEQKFYDDAHKHGKFDKYGGKHNDFTHKGGASKHGTHHDSGYNEAHKDSAGHFNKGNYYDAQKGHSGELGHKSHHDHKTEYGNSSDNKKFGEHEGGDDFY